MITVILIMYNPNKEHVYQSNHNVFIYIYINWTGHPNNVYKFELHLDPRGPPHAETTAQGGLEISVNRI